MFSETLNESRRRITSAGMRILHPDEALYQHYQEMYASNPFKFQVENNGKDVIRAKMHSKGDLVITHFCAKNVRDVLHNSDEFLTRFEEQTQQLSNDDLRSATLTDFIRQFVLPMAQSLELSIYDFNCNANRCLLAASFLARENVFNLLTLLEQSHEHYIVAWSYPIKSSETEVIILDFVV